MAMPLATPATTESSTLYFGPWYRRSPFFEKTLEGGRGRWLPLLLGPWSPTWQLMPGPPDRVAFDASTTTITEPRGSDSGVG
jgi:hypothetical protein